MHDSSYCFGNDDDDDDAAGDDDPDDDCDESQALGGSGASSSTTSPAAALSQKGTGGGAARRSAKSVHARMENSKQPQLIEKAAHGRSGRSRSRPPPPNLAKPPRLGEPPIKSDKVQLIDLDDETSSSAPSPAQLPTKETMVDKLSSLKASVVALQTSSGGQTNSDELTPDLIANQ